MGVIYIYIYIYIYICNHWNNVHSRSSTQWLCGNSCTWTHDIQLHITGTNSPSVLTKPGKESNISSLGWSATPQKVFKPWRSKLGKIYICNHGNNWPSLLSLQWLCGSLRIWKYNIRVRINLLSSFGSLERAVRNRISWAQVHRIYQKTNVGIWLSWLHNITPILLLQGLRVFFIFGGSLLVAYITLLNEINGLYNLKRAQTNSCRLKPHSFVPHVN